MRRLAIVLAILATVSSCGSGSSTTAPPPPPPVTAVATVTLSTSATSLVAGGTLQLTATTLDAGGNVLTGRTVTWASTASTVASVSTSGLVTAVAAGTATISATSEGKSAAAQITVTPVAVASVTLSPTSATVVPTSSATITATPKDAAGNALTGRTVNWNSSAPTIASVSSAGVVTGVAVGSATVTATVEGKTANATISVVAGVVVGAAGGTVISPDGNASVVIPAGALSQPTAISIAPAIGVPADSVGIAGTAYEFQPTGTQFAVPITMIIKYNPANTVPGIPAATLHLNLATSGQWTPVVPSSVDTVAHTISATVSHFSAFQGGHYTVWFNEADDTPGDTPLSPFAVIPVAFETSISLCVGESGAATVTGFRPGDVLPLVNSSVGDANIASFVVSNNVKFWITGKNKGNTTVTGVYGKALAVINVAVNNCTDGVPATVSVTSGPTSADNNVSTYSGGGIHNVTSNNESRHPTHGKFRTPTNLRAPGTANLSAADTPLAYQDLSGPTPREMIYWNGVNGVATPVALPSTAPPYGAGTFTDAGAYLFIGPIGQVADVWAVAAGGNTAVRLTNLNGSANNVTIGPDGTMYLDWRPSGGSSHIWRLQMPAIGSTPVTSGQVQVTSGSLFETQPAISQNGRVLAYSQNDLTYTKAQVFVLSLGTTGATPVPVSPATGFAFSPSWCGNEFLYYVYSTSLGGSYQVMKWNPTLGTTTPVAAFNGLNVYDFAIARTDGDGGVHVCP